MSITTLFESGLYGRLRQQAGSHWQDYVDHPFLQQLAAGTCPNALSPLPDPGLPVPAALRPRLRAAGQQAAHPAGNACRHGVAQRHRRRTAAARGLLRRMGLSEAQIAAQPEAAETMNYTRYVLDIGHAGDALDLLAGLLPCVAGYAEIGLRLLHDPATKMEGNPYASWIRNYGEEGYLAGVRAAIELLETVGHQRGAPGRFTELAQIFTTATQLESAFWQMGLNAS